MSGPLTGAALYLLVPLVAVATSSTSTSTATQVDVPSPESSREAEMFGDDSSSREAEMFGDDSSSREADMFGDDSDSSPTSSTEADMFGGPTESSTASAEAGLSDPNALERAMATLEENDDILDIGGRIFFRLNYQAYEARSDFARELSSPSLVDAYFDARPNDRVRAYIRGRLAYDPTVDENAPNAFGFQQQPLRMLLNQLFLKFDIERTLYVTLGRQPIKWGSGIIWNPSDFINNAVRNPLTVFDERQGADILKLHFPIESLDANIYAIASLGRIDRPDEIGGALRAEIVFGQAEFALSGFMQKDQPTRIAADVSTGLWVFDLRLETTFTHGDPRPFYSLVGGESPFVSRTVETREDEWLFQAVASAEVAIRYSDQDSITIGAEYFYNGAGISERALYEFLISCSTAGDAGRLIGCAGNERFDFLYLGRHYAGLYALLASPGSWNDTTFLLNAIGNLSDRSFLVRANHSVLLLTYLTLNTFVTASFGRDGELHFAPNIPAGTIPTLPTGFSSPAPNFGAGVGLTVNW